MSTLYRCNGCYDLHATVIVGGSYPTVGIPPVYLKVIIDECEKDLHLCDACWERALTMLPEAYISERDT